MSLSLYHSHSPLSPAYALMIHVILRQPADQVDSASLVLLQNSSRQKFQNTEGSSEH